MNFIDNETPRKLRGGYYTPPDIASFLTRWVMGRPVRDVLEPSVGDGAFVRALAALPSRPEHLVACEIDAHEAARAQQAGASLPHAEVWVGDFLGWALDRLTDAGESFDAVMGNPPFIRYQYLDARVQTRAEQLIRGFDLPFTRHTNAWVPFVIASLALLRPGGRLGMVVPAELLHVLHAQSARRFLIERCSDVVVLDPAEIWFEDTLQGVVLLLATRKAPGDTRPGRVAIQAVRGRGFLSARGPTRIPSSAYTHGEDLPRKWMLALLPARARSLLRQLADHPHIHPFRALARVQVGIVTGANRFFLVPDQTVTRYGLEAHARPMFGRSEHVPGVLYDATVHAANQAAGRPTNFLYFEDDTSLSAGARRYIAAGEAQGLHRRYKCRIRAPWFRVPSVFPAPIAMLKRCHDHPRLVLNRIGALTTDTAYRIVAEAPPSEDLVSAFVNSLTALSAELEGRHYGGGVLELVPSEIRRLLVPRISAGANLDSLDRDLRGGCPAQTLLARRDALVLAPLGLSGSDLTILHDAWMALRNRRQRSRSG